MTDIAIDQLIRSKRRSISLQITKDAKLIVRAPHHTSREYIHQIITQKQRWIIKKQEYVRRKPQPIPKAFTPGEEFLFLGQSYPLEMVDDLPKAVVLDGTLKISAMVLGNARDHISIWYKTNAMDYFTQRVKALATQNQLSYQSIKINSASTRWGSCGYNGTLNFTWRLIMAPVRVIDYVIIHELMHLIHRNHSSKFWNAVRLRIPDYKTDERWLTEHGHLLTL